MAGRYDHNWIMINQRSLSHVDERLIKARAKTLVVAAGTIERPYVFEGNDLPGVMLGGAVRRLINLYGVRPGTRAVVFTGNDEGEAAAADLARAGVDVARAGGRSYRWPAGSGQGPGRSVVGRDGWRQDCQGRSAGHLCWLDDAYFPAQHGGL